MLFTLWISNPCCVLIVCTVMRDSHDPHLPVDVINKSLEKKRSAPLGAVLLPFFLTVS